MDSLVALRMTGGEEERDANWRGRSRGQQYLKNDDDITKIGLITFSLITKTTICSDFVVIWYLRKAQIVTNLSNGIFKIVVSIEQIFSPVTSDESLSVHSELHSISITSVIAETLHL